MSAFINWFCLLIIVLTLTYGASAIENSNRFEAKFANTKHIPNSKSFFSGGRDALAWDAEDLTEARDIHKKEFNDEQVYMASYNLADYLGMHMVEAIHMPIPLNIIFIGFSGDGNMDVNITKEELVTWFEHLDHILPHTRISLTELSCLEDGHCSAYMKAEKPAPLHSYVHLNLSCHVVDLDSKSVLENFEKAISTFSRPVDPSAETGMQQVDAVKMENFVDNFIKSLGFVDHYSILVLNPRWTTQRPQYGYRTGFSTEEMALLTSHRIADKVLSLRHELDHDPEPEQKPLWSHSWDSPWTYPRHSAEKFKIHDAVWNGNHWVKSASEYLSAEETYRSALLKKVGGETGAAAILQAARTLSSQKLKRENADTLKAHLLLNPEAFGNQNFPTSPPIEDCLVHSWVSHERWLLIDLTAGGFEWGPALGGEGVVHSRSVPIVQDHFFAVKEIKDELKTHKADAEADSALRGKLEKEKAERLGAISNKHHHAFFRQHQLNEQNMAPGSQGRQAVGDPVQKKWERHHNELLMQAELDLLEEFAKKMCHKRQAPPPLCEELKSRVEELHHGLKATSATTGNIPSLSREHNWDIFGAVDQEVEEDPEVFQESYRQKELFLAHLSAVMSRGIRHVIAPPTATWHHDGYLHDTATPYAQEVEFELFLIRDTSRAVGLPSMHDFPVEAFKEQVSSLKLGHQTFRFTTRPLTLLDDPALAAAFSASLRTTYQQVPVSNEKLFEFEQLYLDSRDLANRLRAQFGTAPRRGAARAHAQLQVPVFIFMLDRASPVLIDQHYNAKALEDMVMVVQNSAQQDEHPVGFSCNGKMQSRTQSPLKESLAAVLMHLGGVLPPHLGYRPASHTITMDWFWSLGAHPFSATSTGVRYTKMQRDALHRSYMLDAIDTSIDRVNEGLFLLTQQVPEKGVFPHIKQHEHHFREIMSQYTSLVLHWHGVLQQAQSLGFSAAVDLIHTLESSATEFLDKCKEVRAVLHPLNCRARSNNLDYVGWMPHPIILTCGGVGLLCFLYSVYTTHAITKAKKH